MQGLLWGNGDVPELDSGEECAALRRYYVSIIINLMLCVTCHDSKSEPVISLCVIEP